MCNPVMKLVEWLKNQEKEVQEDIAFLMSMCSPVFNSDEIPADRGELVAQFYAQIESYSGNQTKNLGFLVSFRAVFDFLFVRTRGTEEAWDKTEEMFKSMSKEDKLNEIAVETLAKIPERKKQWLGICKEWEELKRTNLSDEIIDTWERKNMFEGIKNHRMFR